MPRVQSHPAVLRHTIRAARVVLGLALLVVGVVLSLPGVPGPGILLVLGGLTVLSGEFVWAERLRDRMHEWYRRIIHRNEGESDGR
jgi:uncharacterized membrane protein HdeD (DUF308 family)